MVCNVLDVVNLSTIGVAPSQETGNIASKDTIEILRRA